IPIENYIRVGILERMGPEVDVADPSPEARMPADWHERALLTARRLSSPVCLHSHVIAQCAETENVIPAAHLKHGNSNFRKILLDRPLFPIVVVIGMREPILVIRSNGSCELRIGRQLPAVKKRVIREGTGRR